MSEPQTSGRESPSRATAYLQFAATAAGFLVSTYFVSTVLFNWGPHQDIPAWVRWAVGGFALLFTLSVVVGLAYAASRGYRAFRMEGEELLLFKKPGGTVVARIALREVESAAVRRDDWDVISSAEGSDVEAIGLQTAGEGASTPARHHAELEIRARGKPWVLMFAGHEQAVEAEQAILAAVKAAKS